MTDTMVANQCQEMPAAPLRKEGTAETFLPQIVTTRRPMRGVSEDALAALNRANIPPRLFVRSGRVVHIVHDEVQRPSIRNVDSVSLRGMLDRAANFVTDRGHAVVPPKDVVNDIL